MIASKQNAALFADKEQVWADNAATSPYFGNAYVCYAGFRLAATARASHCSCSPRRDGGTTWTQKQVTAATNNPNSQQRLRAKRLHRAHRLARRRVRVRLRVRARLARTRADPDGQVADGGENWTTATHRRYGVRHLHAFEPSIGRCVMDGVAGARDDLSPAPRST